MEIMAATEPKRYGHLDPLLGSDLFYSFIRSIGRGDALQFAQSLFDRYGKTFIATVFGRTLLNTMDAKNIQVVLSSTDVFTVAPVRQEALEPLMGKAIFTTDGPTWSRSRSLIKPIVAKAHSPATLLPSTLTFNICWTVFLTTGLRWIYSPYSGLSAMFLTLRSSWSRFKTALQACGTRMFMGKFSFLMGGAAALKKSCKQVHEAIDNLVKDALQARKDGLSDTFLDRLMESTEDRLEIRYQIPHVFLPGYDSNALGLGQIFFQLARNPSVWSKLREEVLALDRSRTITFEDVRSLKYLKCVVTECFRLISPFGINIRRCTADTTLPSGGGLDGNSAITIHKGTEINMVYLLTQRDPEIWGEDAAQFRPERWNDPAFKPMACEYMPFSAGKRAFPGQQMALSECSCVLARFVQAFPGIENRDPEMRYVEEHRMAMQSRNGVKVAFPLA